MDPNKKSRRISTVPRLPDDDSDVVITSMPPLTTPKLYQMEQMKDKPLPILIPEAPNGQSNDKSSVSSSISTSGKSVLNVKNGNMKSSPVVSTTTTTVNSSSDNAINSNFNGTNATSNEKKSPISSKESLVDDLRNELKNSSSDLDDMTASVGMNNDSASVVGSFLKNITGYGEPGKSAVNETVETTDKATDLDDGIKFENDKGAEMLTYRRSKGKGNSRNVTPNAIYHRRNISHSSTISSNSNTPDLNPTGTFVNNLSPAVVPPTPKEVDYNRFVEEKYLDTQYRYATPKRDEEFHQLFENVPSDDRLLDDFSCALSREILLQGRIYISEHYLCFNSSLLGWVTSLVISLDEIMKFERRSTAGLFPNGIIIETKDFKHVFASFISRDQTLNFIETIWSKSISLSKKNHEKPRDFESIQSKSSFESVNGKNVKLLSESDLYTIDGDSSSEYLPSAAAADDTSSLDNSETRTSIGENNNGNNNNDDNENNNNSNNDVKVKKGKHVNKFSGPRGHTASDYNIDYESTNQKIVLDKSYNIPLGLLYDIFFGNDIQFHKNMMILNDGLNFTDYSGFDGEGSERTFEYDKKLNYPIGPSSTRVYCTEKLEHLDFNNYIEILNISKTPNVPSGGAFDCRTRYLMKWDSDNKTRLIISFKLEWSGTSWFKSVIETSALSGQSKAAGDVDIELMKIIPQKVIEFSLDSKEEETEISHDISNVHEGQATEKTENVKQQQQQEVITNISIKPSNEIDFTNILKKVIITPIGNIPVSACLIIFSILFVTLVGTVFRINRINSQMKSMINNQSLILNTIAKQLDSLQKTIEDKNNVID